MSPMYHPSMANRLTDKIPVVYKTWIQGTVCTRIEFVSYEEMLLLKETNFKWEWIQKLNIMGMVENYASVGYDDKEKPPEVGLIVSEGMLEKVNKILEVKD